MKRIRCLCAFCLTAAILAALLSCGGGGDAESADGGKTVNTVSGYSYRSNGAYIDGMPEIIPAEGIYYGDVSISMSSSLGYEIRYTEDCSRPTVESPLYESSFTVGVKDGRYGGGAYVCVIRAAAFDGNGEQVGQVITCSYIFPTAENRFSTEIVSLVADPDDLYGYERGILVQGKMADLYNRGETYIGANYNGRGREWEREASFTLYSADGRPEFSQNIGIRVNGTGSRANVQKNFRLFARRDYTPETGKMKYEFFEDQYSPYTGKKIKSFDTLLLRGGASNINNSMITGAIAYSAVYDCENLLTARMKPVAAFLNGEYYGLMMITEDYSPDYFEEYYGINADYVATINMTVVQNEAKTYLAWELDDGEEKDRDDFLSALMQCVNLDMSVQKNYDRFRRFFDVDNVIEYYVTECYLNNWDWPRNNVRVWRYTLGGYNPDGKPGYDGRWRFVVKDSDMTLGTLNPVGNGVIYGSGVEENFFTVGEKDDSTPSLLGPIVRALLKNSEFRQKFITFVCDYASGAGDPGALLERISVWEAIVAPEMQYHLEVIGKAYGLDALSWSRNLEICRDFADRRQLIVLGNVEQRLGCDITAVTVNPYSGGTLYLNGIPMRRQGQSFWTELGAEVEYAFIPDDGYEGGELETKGSFLVSEGSLVMTEKRGSITPVFTPADVKHGQEKERSYSAAVPEISKNAVVVNGTLYSWPSLDPDSKVNIEKIGQVFGKNANVLITGAAKSLNITEDFKTSDFIKSVSAGGRAVYVEALNTYIIYNPSLKTK